MLILGIDTSTKVATAALIKDEEQLGETFLHTGNNHSQHLMPLIQGLLNLCQVQPNQLHAVAVALGPGSFTGLRIGLATAKGLAGALDIPLVGIPTLDGLVYNLAGAEGIVCPVLDARKQQVYTSLYSWSKEEQRMNRLSDYLVVTPKELANKLLASDIVAPIHFLGDGVHAYKDVLTSLLAGKELCFTHQPNSLARGGQIAWLGLKYLQKDPDNQRWSNFHSLAPLYLRDSEAEVNLKQKQLKANGCG